MSKVEKMLRDKQFNSGTTMDQRLKSGKSYILTKLRRLRLRDLMKNLASTSTDHSTWSLSFHSTELLRCLVEPTWFSRDGERTPDNNNSGSMKSPRLSETTTGRTIASTSRAMVTAATSEL
jgi:hypothetical protein